MESSDNSKCLADVQSSCSNYSYPIERVGITDFQMPIYICRKEGGYQHTVSDIDVFVDLDKDSKGINMSRLPIGLEKFSNQALNAHVLEDIAEYVRHKSEAENCQIIYKFPYFMTKFAPVSKEPSTVHYNIEFNLTKSVNKEFDLHDKIFWMTIKCNVTSLCPCSKEISEYSAHNQRGTIKIQLTPKDNEFVWIEDIIELAESSGSCRTYGALKRPDEKYVTEEAYNNPKFVEDMIRSCYNKLIEREDIKDFRIEVKNYESIHQHNACAIMDSRVIDDER